MLTFKSPPIVVVKEFADPAGLSVKILLIVTVPEPNVYSLSAPESVGERVKLLNVTAPDVSVGDPLPLKMTVPPYTAETLIH